MEIYLEASGASSKTPKARAAIILHCAGPEAIEVFDQMEFSEDEDRDDPNTVLNKLEEYCIPRSNEVLQRYRFWNIPYCQPFDKFVTELKGQAEQCNFEERDKMIRDKIVFSVPKHLKEKLLKDIELTLKRAIEICQAHEQTASHIEEMQPSKTRSMSQKIDRVTTNSKRKLTKKGKAPIECRYCGFKHDFDDKKKCPAWGKSCSRCKGKNHFKAKCRSKINAVQVDDEASSDEQFDNKWLSAVSNSVNTEQSTCVLKVNDNKVRFQIDTAADVNTICQRYVRRNQVVPTKTRLVMWNKSKMIPSGETTLDVINPKTNSTHKVHFIVVKNGFSCLLGLKTLQDLNFVTFNDEKYVAKMTIDNKLGDLGEARLKLDQSKQPRQLPCRKVPFALQDKVKSELQNLIERGILCPVDEPTDWVSQMAVVEKANGGIRICIDPRPLNEALMREHHKLLTLDDVLPKFQNAKVFTKLDVKEAFWHIRLDRNSSFLTTMITPIGRVRWTRLPFGLNVSSEIFSKHLSSALQGLDGIINVADDIIVIGCGKTKEDALNNHEDNYEKLKERCQQRDIRLNEQKARERQDEVIFMGHRISDQGIEPDQKKVVAILNMPTPRDIHDVKRFCGMVQYLSRFLTKLSDMLKPLRDLTKKDRSFSWTEECDRSFKKVKEAISKTPVLKYYDENKELELQVDSSKDGLGAVLMQDGQPIEFASRTLTETEQRWAQIEKEMLAIVFGLERFDQYTYGRRIFVTSDHKPLETIIRKPLSEVPRRLQRLLMRSNRYDIELKWTKGSSLLIADTLSRASISNITSTDDIQEPEEKTYLPDETLKKIKFATHEDNSLQVLKRVILNGWPEHKDKVPAEIRPYFDLRDTISVEDGVIVKGERILIPKSLRNEIKGKLHSAHMATDSMLRRARRTVFWPGMTTEIKQMAEACEICQQSKRKNQKESLKQHERGYQCWEKVGTDLFHIQGRNYIVLVDYFSNFIEVEYLPTMSTKTVIAKMKANFSRYGSPKILISDCGPQYTSKEFKEFTRRWGINHVTSSPGHQQANGKAESAVKIIKQMMERCINEGGDQYEALLELRNTPRQNGFSPAEMLFQTEPRTLIPKFSKPRSRYNTLHEQRDRIVKNNYDKRTRDMTQLSADQPVWYQNPEDTKWHPGVVRNQLNERSYTIEGENGGVYRRNRVHLRPKTTPFEQRNTCNNDDESCDDTEIPTATPEVPTETPEVSTTTQNSDVTPHSQSENTRLSTDTLQTNRYVTRYGRTIKPNPKYT